MYIHISNINKRVTNADVYTLLSVYKSVEQCIIHHIRNTKTRETNTYALVDMTDSEEMKAAVMDLNQTIFGGRKINVQIGG